VTTNEQGSLIFNSGDGVEVELIDIKARLKSPESMFAKLGKDVSGEVFNIRDILAITFLIKNKDDSLKLFHSLQKQGVILQEIRFHLNFSDNV
jgi:ppGpp synthetase/RelA/SpoT-type nucleotidyltranferase